MPHLPTAWDLRWAVRSSSRVRTQQQTHTDSWFFHLLPSFSELQYQWRRRGLKLETCNYLPAQRLFAGLEVPSHSQ